MYRHILIPIDGSELARKGLDHGVALAKAVGASVTIVTITENELLSPLAMAEEARRGVNPLEEYRDAMNRHARNILESASQRAAPANISFKTVHVAERSPAEGILEAAEENDCDLIVMSSHGRRGVRRLMLGSQTAEVVASTSIPVLVVR